MSLLSHNELINLVQNRVITASLDNINGTSIDVTLADDFLSEVQGTSIIVNPAVVATTPWETLTSCDGKITLAPGEIILGRSEETFNLPNNISAEYKLTSSLARLGLDHSNAGWCNPGWNNSSLTLELKNNLQHHSIILTAGMKIGHMVFYLHEYAPKYNGSYNNTLRTTEASM